MPTESAVQALEILRNPVTFQWYIIPLFALIVYGVRRARPPTCY
jgi:hypothetical protein